MAGRSGCTRVAQRLVRAPATDPGTADLTRARSALARERGRLVCKIEKVLESAGIKLSSVASDIVGVSGRLMLDALIGGCRDPEVMAELAKRKLRRKIPALQEALNGRFTEHHGFLIRMHLDLIDEHTRALDTLEARIEEAIEPFTPARELLCSIPGRSTRIAEVFIAETGADMTVFATPGQLASWAGGGTRGQRVGGQGQINQDPPR